MEQVINKLFGAKAKIIMGPTVVETSIDSSISESFQQRVAIMNIARINNGASYSQIIWSKGKYIGYIIIMGLTIVETSLDSSISESFQ
jgi:hypothetical protein